MQQFTSQLIALSGEYLFFIGATYIAALLLRKRYWLWSALSFAVGTLWLTFHLPVTLYLESLGVDSFAEANNFDLKEAHFWLQTLGEAIYPKFSIKKFIAYLVVALSSFYALHWLFHRHELTRRSYVVAKYTLALSLMGVAVHHTASRAIAFYLENSEAFVTTAQNFTNEAPALGPGKVKTSLLVYVGESTSAMNMSLYGYPRPTTPRLKQMAQDDPQLLVFGQVFATHAHTSRSLLEALSFGLNPDEGFLPITRRHRLSVVDVLQKAELSPRLVSNQGVGGSWDQASSVIFKHADKVFRARPQPTDVDVAAAPSPWDDEFFQAPVNTFAARKSPGALFLHSYAGHGPYYGNIPESFRKPVDDSLSRLRPDQVLMDKTQSVALVEEYDAALRYVDYSVSKTIGLIKKSSQPIVFVYFSDHGDAAFAGRGHDSARFKHEMARVPFLIYFNDAIVKANPRLFKKYRQLAARNEIATLAQLPTTLMDLLGIRIKPQNPPVLLTALVGEKTALPPIMVRETSEGMTFVNLNRTALHSPASFGYKIIDKTDDDTRHYVNAEAPSGSEQCDASAMSLEALSRSIMVKRCLPAAVDSATAKLEADCDGHCGAKQVTN